MYSGSCVLEDYYYILRDHSKRNTNEVPKQIRFTGRKISEFKHEIFIKNFAYLRSAIAASISNSTLNNYANYEGYSGPNGQLAGLGIGCLTDKDLEVLYNGQIMDNDDEMEYCFT
jgi:hypothetical protein